MKNLVIVCFLNIPAIILAAKCTYDGIDYEKGVSFPSNDGCNTCYCEGNGFVSCTEGCLPGNTPDNCFYNGQTYKIGDAFLDKDGCNRCTCERDQIVACTKKACVKQKAQCKDADGIEHPEGASIPAEDGCNSCVCSQKGLFICTLKECSTRAPIVKSRSKGANQTNSATLCNSVNYWVGVILCMFVVLVK